MSNHDDPAHHLRNLQGRCSLVADCKNLNGHLREQYKCQLSLQSPKQLCRAQLHNSVFGCGEQYNEQHVICLKGKRNHRFQVSLVSIRLNKPLQSRKKDFNIFIMVLQPINPCIYTLSCVYSETQIPVLIRRSE